MKPINGIRYLESREALHVKSEKITPFENDRKNEQAWILDALRSTYISENSSFMFCKDTDLISEPLTKVSFDRQAVVEELLHKFSSLSMEERLLFFLRIPATNSQKVFDPKLNILAGRVELRRTAAWIKSHLQIDYDSSIPKRDVYDKYLEYCVSSRMIPISIADFGKVMKHMYPTVRPRRLGTRGKSQYCYAGMTNCQDLKRPDLYDDNVCPFVDEDDSFCQNAPGEIPYTCQNFKPQQCIEESKNLSSKDSFVNCDSRKNMFDTTSKDNQFKFSGNCSAFVKRCKQRKALICSRNKFKKPIFNTRSLKDFQFIDHSSDFQVEEEIAQYFQGENTSMKLARGNTPSANAFHRSVSYTGCSNIQYLPKNRSQSSVAFYPPKWTNDESITENRHSASCVAENLQFRSDSREATEKLSQLRLQSQSSQNSRHSLENSGDQCGFTPISPSPIPWSLNSTPAPDSHQFLKPDSINFPTEVLIRPRSFSTENKLNLKRDFQNAFSRITMCSNSEVEKQNFSAVDAFRSQSLPCFGQKQGPDEHLNQPIEENNEMIEDSENSTIICEELGSIFSNQMATNDICYVNEKFDDNLTPSQDGLISQLDGILNGMKPEHDIIQINDTHCKLDIDRDFGILSRNSSVVNTSQEIFKNNFDPFF